LIWDPPNKETPPWEIFLRSNWGGYRGPEVLVVLKLSALDYQERELSGKLHVLLKRRDSEGNGSLAFCRCCLKFRMCVCVREAVLRYAASERYWDSLLMSLNLFTQLSCPVARTSMACGRETTSARRQVMRRPWALRQSCPRPQLRKTSMCVCAWVGACMC